MTTKIVKVGSVTIGELRRTPAGWQPVSGFLAESGLRPRKRRADAENTLLAVYAVIVGASLLETMANPEIEGVIGKYGLLWARKALQSVPAGERYKPGEGAQAQGTLVAAARGARLMLYAWRGVRERDGLPNHPELNSAIAELEAALGVQP